MYVCMHVFREGEREREIHFMELAHIIVEAGKSKICGVGWPGTS